MASRGKSKVERAKGNVKEGAASSPAIAVW
jgi:hypothetical protein